MIKNKSCSNGHVPIIFEYISETESCPLCEALKREDMSEEIEGLNDNIIDLTDEVNDLIDKIDDLKDQLEHSRNECDELREENV